MSDVLVRIDDLRVAYRVLGQTQVALEGVSLDVRAGESVALIGKSGSGKSTIASALLGLLPANARVLSGTVEVEGLSVLGERAATLRRRLARAVGYVPQDPGSALNPVRSIRSQFFETLRAKGLEPSEELAVSTLASVGIPEPQRILDQYPHQLSGGLLQRVLIANAIVARPRLLIADEPTSALDVTTQHEILALIERLRDELGMSVLFITHNLSIAASHSDRVMVLNEGRIVERGASYDVLSAPSHEYTRALVRDIPRPIDEILSGKPPAPRRSTPYLEVRSVTKRFDLRGGGSLVAADAVSFSVLPRTTHAIVGESGSGKTTIARIILGLETATDGGIAIEEEVVDYGNRAALREHRRHLQLVFQNPFGSLDPESSIARIVEEPLLRYRIGSRTERRARVAELLDDVGLPASVAVKKPRELSGGQRQRVSIARALSLNPRMLVLDEPTSALDVSVQAQIVELLRRLQAEHGLTYLFVSHDLGLVAEFADTLTVMRRGFVVEDGTVAQVLGNPSEQYTADLLASTPGNDREPELRSA